MAAEAPGQERRLPILLLAQISATGFLVKGVVAGAASQASSGAQEKRTDTAGEFAGAEPMRENLLAS
jgi:hypothetical protein